MSDKVAAPTPDKPLPQAAKPVTGPDESSVAAQQSDNVAHALAGAGGGLLSMALTYPLITLSTRAQVEKKKAGASVGTLAAAKRIVDREGIQGLYAGMESALFGITVTNFVYYYWYEFSRAFFQRTTNKSRLSTLESMAAGALAGTATVFMTNPIWVVNTRMTARQAESHSETVLPTDEKERQSKKASPSTISTFLKIVREDGFLRLFAGVLPALVLVINPILQYTVFEQLKQLLEKRRKVGATDSFLLGALGKLAATTITYPYITVKSRAHVAQGKGLGMTESLKKIVNEEGVAGLYGGIVPKVSQSVITAAFLFAFKDVLYEAMVKARRKVAVPKRLPTTKI